MIAKTTNLNLFYGKKQALFDINMQIEQNKLLHSSVLQDVVNPLFCAVLIE